METNYGSTWAKWDLHIHSKYSLESICNLGIKDIFDLAIGNNIEVVSITDHTNFDNLDETWDLWENGHFEFPDSSSKPYKDLISFIPGIELKADLGKRGVHFIALFPNEITIGGIKHKATKQFLIDNFLSKIDCSKAEILHAGSNDYSKGLLIKSVNFESAVRTIRALNGLKLVHNGTKDHGFDREISHPSSKADEYELLNTLGDSKEKLMRHFIDICEFPNTSDYHKKEAEFYWKEFNKPSLIFSDSHKDYEGLVYTWIKGDRNIEGLRQTLYEKSRYCWPNKEPLYPINKINIISINFPENLKYKNESFCYSGFKKDIYFSPYFTCLIGGRGTGKSSLLNLIHDCITDNPRKLDITLDGRKIDVKDYTLIDINNAKIEYLSQNEIEEFAKDKQKLTDAIFSRLQSLYYSDIEPAKTLLTNSIKEMTEIFEDKINLYLSKNDLAKTEKELQEKRKIIESFSSADYKRISTEIQKENESLQAKLASKSKYNKLIEVITNLKDEYAILTINNKYDEAISSILSVIQKELEKYEASYFDKIEQEIRSNQETITILQDELTKYLEKRGLSQENMSDVTRASSEIAVLEKKISDLKIEIDELNSAIASFDLTACVNNCEQYKSIIEERIASINNDKLKQIESEYVKEISLEFEFNLANCYNEIFNQFKTTFDTIIANYKSTDNFDDSKLKELLTQCFDIHDDRIKYLQKVEKFDTQSKAKQFLLYLFKNENFFDFFTLIAYQHYFNFEKFKLIKVTYGGKVVQNTSFGQRCTAALVIILSLGNNPIIIDEPEAHLDSALISNYLVELIKQNKRHRQIIFATHNSNFVINGDAELIHVLTISNAIQTEINPTTIENLDTRKDLIALEGGIEAFKRREEKYGV